MAEETASGGPGRELSPAFCGGLVVGDEESGLALVQRREEKPQGVV